MVCSAVALLISYVISNLALTYCFSNQITEIFLLLSSVLDF